MPLYQNSQNTFIVEYFDVDGQTKIPASTVAYARWSLIIDGSFLSLDTNSGVTVEGDDFKVTTPMTLITQSGSATHQFSVGNSETELEPPIFQRPIEILPVQRQ